MVLLLLFITRSHLPVLRAALSSAQRHLWVPGQPGSAAGTGDAGLAAEGCEWSPVSVLGGALNPGSHPKPDHYSLTAV